MNMKKSLLFAGLAAVLTLASCSKSEENYTPAEGNEITVIALQDDTKTTNDGFTTKWADGDKLSAFFAYTGTTDYEPLVELTYDSGSSFKGTATLDDGENYDWYFLYPYNSYLKDPENSDNGWYAYIGCRSDWTQKQTGYDSKAHLAGGTTAAYFPLYGIAEDVAFDAEPTVTMHQVASVVAIKVTNTASTPVTITKASLTAEEPIMGSFYLGLSKSGIDIRNHTNASYMSNTATVEVSGGTELATGASATLYVGVKPFVAASGSKLTLKVKGTNGELSVDKTMTGDVTFAEGHIKNLSINYNLEGGTPVVASKVSDVLEGGAKTYDKMENLLVYGVNGKNAIVGDETGKMLLFMTNTLKAGDNISITDATTVEYQGMLEITGGTIAVNSQSNAVDHGTAVNLDDATAASSTYATFSATGYHSAVFVSMTGTQSSRNITGTQEHTTLYMNGTNSTYDGKTVKVTGYVYSWSTSHSNYNFHLISIEEDDSTPALSVSPASLSWGATEYGATSGKDITVTLNGGAAEGDYTVSGSNSDWSVTTSGNTITVYPVAANTSTTDAKSVTLTIAHKANTALTKEVTLTQAKAVSGGFTPFNVWEDDFDGCSNSGTALTKLDGNVSGFSGSYSGFSFTYPMTGAIRIGKASAAGSITTPVLSDITGSSVDLTVSFKAAGWKGKTAKLTLTVNKGEVTEGQTTITSEDSMSGSTPSMTGTEYTFHITGADSTTAITFTTTNSIGIDDLVVTQTSN